MSIHDDGMGKMVTIDGQLVGPILKIGVLYKLGSFWKRWKPRTFVLTPHVLFYFLKWEPLERTGPAHAVPPPVPDESGFFRRARLPSTDSNASDAGRRSRGHLALSKVVSVTKDMHRGRLCICVETKERLHYLQPVPLFHIDSWIDTLVHASRQLRRKMAATGASLLKASQTPDTPEQAPIRNAAMLKHLQLFDSATTSEVATKALVNLAGDVNQESSRPSLHSLRDTVRRLAATKHLELRMDWEGGVNSAFEQLITAIDMRVEALGQHDVFASSADLHVKESAPSLKPTIATASTGAGVGVGAGAQSPSEGGGDYSHTHTVARHAELRLSRSFTNVERTRTAVSLHSQYTLGKKLGTGGFSVVYEATHIATGQKFAVKCVKKSALSERDLASLETEVRHLKRLHHPHIVSIKAAFNGDSNYFYLVSELVQGGELFDSIMQKEGFNEAVARDISHQLVDAISYMHRAGIVHRDLKPENILITEGDDPCVKIADFGFSATVDSRTASDLLTTCGTPGYVPPELLLKKGYGPPRDMWSVGVIVFIMLCGYPPFFSKDQSTLFKLIKTGKFKFESPYWDGISDDAKDLISKLLVVDPAKRLTAMEALQHPWMCRAHVPSRDLPDVLVKLRRFNNQRRLRAVVNTVITFNRLRRSASNRSNDAGTDAESSDPDSPRRPSRLRPAISAAHPLSMSPVTGHLRRVMSSPANTVSPPLPSPGRDGGVVGVKAEVAQLLAAPTHGPVLVAALSATTDSRSHRSTTPRLGSSRRPRDHIHPQLPGEQPRRPSSLRYEVAPEGSARVEAISGSAPRSYSTSPSEHNMGSATAASNVGEATMEPSSEAPIAAGGQCHTNTLNAE